MGLRRGLFHWFGDVKIGHSASESFSPKQRITGAKCFFFYIIYRLIRFIVTARSSGKNRKAFLRDFGTFPLYSLRCWFIIRIQNPGRIISGRDGKELNGIGPMWLTSILIKFCTVRRSVRLLQLPLAIFLPRHSTVLYRGLHLCRLESIIIISNDIGKNKWKPAFGNEAFYFENNLPWSRILVSSTGWFWMDVSRRSWRVKYQRSEYSNAATCCLTLTSLLIRLNENRDECVGRREGNAALEFLYLSCPWVFD